MINYALSQSESTLLGLGFCLNTLWLGMVRMLAGGGHNNILS